VDDSGTADTADWSHATPAIPPFAEKRIEIKPWSAKAEAVEGMEVYVALHTSRLNNDWPVPWRAEMVSSGLGTNSPKLLGLLPG
jgi:hypothetical protein